MTLCRQPQEYHEVFADPVALHQCLHGVHNNPWAVAHLRNFSPSSHLASAISAAIELCFAAAGLMTSLLPLRCCPLLCVHSAVDALLLLQLFELLLSFVGPARFRQQLEAALPQMVYVAIAYLQMTQVRLSK
jgi:hypothetical protein